MNSPKQYVIALLTTAFTLFLLALFVYFKDRKNKINITYATFILSAFLWTFGEAFLIVAPTKEIAIFWNRVCNFGIFFIATGFVHFILTLLQIDNKKFQRIIIVGSYIFSFLSVGLLFTDRFLPPPIPKFSLNYFIEPGPYIYALFVFIWFCQVAYAFYELLKAYLVSAGTRRNQLKYLLIGAFIGYIGGAGNYFLTFGKEIFLINPFGTYSVVIYAIMMTYAIVRYRLLDINIVLTRAGIFALVYTLVLGIPLGLTGWGKHWLQGFFGINWYWAPVILAIILATAGPFIFMFLQKRAINALLKEQRRYQKALTDFSKTLIGIRNLEELLNTITSTIAKEVKMSFVAIYLKEPSYNNSYQRKSCCPRDTQSRFPEFIQPDDPVIKELLQKQKPLLSDEVPPQDKIYLDSGLVMPCFGKEGLLAVLILGAKPNNQMYTPDDMPIFENFGYASSMAIENCKFWKQIEEHQRQARIHEMNMFAYSVAHEIDNPMSIIQGFTDLLCKFFINDLNLTEEQKKEVKYFCDTILGARKRVSAIVKAVENFGKPSDGIFIPLKLTEDVITGFEQLCIPNYKFDGVTYSRNLPQNQNIPFVMGIAQELQQVLVILSNNGVYAVKAVPGRRGQITLAVELPNPDILRIIFSDNGEGIPKENLSVIFRPLSTTKASSVGTGMGLFNATNIIQGHNGRIWAESDGPGKGASFIIELPVAKGITEEDYIREKDKRKIIF